MIRTGRTAIMVTAAQIVLTLQRLTMFCHQRMVRSGERAFVRRLGTCYDDI